MTVTRTVTLTPAETHIYVLLGRGLCPKQIAAVRETSESTIKRQMHNARIRSGVRTTTHLAVMVALRRREMEREKACEHTV